MKSYHLVLSALIGLLSACNNSPRVPASPESPKALQENKDSYSIISKRGPDDFVEKLFAEALENDSVLNRLENNISALYDGEKDSLSAFLTFTEKNNSYYKNALDMAAQISDSSWRKLVDSVVKKSHQRYQQKITSHEQLKKQIKICTTELEDFRSLCKLAYTLPMIEGYQKNLPPLAQLQGYKKQLDTLTRESKNLAADKLGKTVVVP